MRIPTRVGGKLTRVMDTTIFSNCFKPSVGSVTKLSQSLLKFKDSSECGGFFGVDAFEDAFINLWSSSVSKGFWFPPPPGHEGPADVISAGWVELL